MSRSYRILLYAVLATGSTVPAVPVAAQGEAPPNQFSDKQAAQRALTKLQDQIAVRQQELEGYYAALHRQLDTVEQARELAAGSGAMGDAAGMYIDAYLKEQRALEVLTNHLDRRIRMAKDAIRALENQLVRTAPAFSAGPGRHGT
jgi:hypothetical protein